MADGEYKLSQMGMTEEQILSLMKHCEAEREQVSRNVPVRRLGENAPAGIDACWSAIGFAAGFSPAVALLKGLMERFLYPESY